jgi:hypothetical protein
MFHIRDTPPYPCFDSLRARRAAALLDWVLRGRGRIEMARSDDCRLHRRHPIARAAISVGSCGAAEAATARIGQGGGMAAIRG